jgi:serine/threonine protein kinase
MSEIINYEKLQSLHLSAFAEVFEGEDFEANRKIRILDLSVGPLETKIQDPSIWQDALRPLKLSHSSNIQVLRAIQNRGWIITEWAVEAFKPDIRSLSTDEVLRVGQEILTALKNYHEKGLVYGALQPSACLKDASGQIMLDYSPGLYLGGEIWERSNQWAFAAPELINPSLGSPSPASDIYSLGILLTYLLAGSREFQQAFPINEASVTTERESWYAWHANEETSLRDLGLAKSLPADVVNLLAKMTEKQVSQRFQSVDETLEALTQLGKTSAKRNSTPPTPTPTPTPTLTAKPSPQAPKVLKSSRFNSRHMLIIAISATLLLSVITVALLMSGGGDKVGDRKKTGKGGEQQGGTRIKEETTTEETTTEETTTEETTTEETTTEETTTEETTTEETTTEETTTEETTTEETTTEETTTEETTKEETTKEETTKEETTKEETTKEETTVPPPVPQKYWINPVSGFVAELTVMQDGSKIVRSEQGFEVSQNSPVLIQSPGYLDANFPEVGTGESVADREVRLQPILPAGFTPIEAEGYDPATGLPNVLECNRFALSEAPIRLMLVSIAPREGEGLNFNYGHPGPLRPGELAVRQESIDYPFYISEFEIARAHTVAYEREQDPEYIGGSGQHATIPKVNIPWQKASAVCAWLGGRLPSESEWELAVRDRRDTGFPFPGILGDLQESDFVIGKNEEPTDFKVATKDRSSYGVCHVMGNVAEWCLDQPSIGDLKSTGHISGTETDQTQEAERYRVVRGYSFKDEMPDGEIRCTRRQFKVFNESYSDIGFRVVVPMTIKFDKHSAELQ